MGIYDMINCQMYNTLESKLLHVPRRVGLSRYYLAGSLEGEWTFKNSKVLNHLRTGNHFSKIRKTEQI